MIIYFQLNLNLSEKFLKRTKRREQIKMKNIRKIVIVKNSTIQNKTKVMIGNKEKNFDDFKYPSPIYLKYLKIIKNNKISNERIENMNIFGEFENSLGNPIKKKNRNIKNKNPLFDNNPSSIKEIFNKNNISKNEKNIIIDKKDYPYHMDENQIYKMFLTIHNNSDSELNQMDYKDAIKSDKRTYFDYYLSLLRTKNLVFFSFWPMFDYNSKILKIFLFFFNFTLSFFVNALFFSDEKCIKFMKIKVHLI